MTGTENQSEAMTVALLVKNKIGFIDGSCVKLDTNATLFQQWRRCDPLVLLDHEFSLRRIISGVVDHPAHILYGKISMKCLIS